jgi:beta-lactam-binding protein with PASTA domain
MHRHYKNPVVFWTANVAGAVVLFFLACLLVLDRLDSYTRHGHYILVPDLRGVLPVEARGIAGEWQLDVVVVDSVYTSGGRPGVVVEQFPRPDAKVKNNRVIQLTVNATGPEMIPFPELNQPSFRQALQRLRAAHLQAGRIEYVASPYTNLVIGFRADGKPVETGTRLPAGTSVDILLGNGGTAPRETVVPRLAGKGLDEARDLLLHAYLNVDGVNVDATIRDETDLAGAFVHEQRPAAGHVSRAGRAVTLFLTRDPAKFPKPEVVDETNAEDER